MARSLARNTKLYISTLDDDVASCTGVNTFEVKVLDGYSFSQDVATQDVGISEAESSCASTDIARGTLSFNTALNPVDVSFSTYVRPYTSDVDVLVAAGSNVDCVERILWASAMGTEASWTEVTTSGGPAAGEVIEAQGVNSIKFGLGKSNSNSLLDLTLYFVLEQTTYKITKFNVNSVEVDFSIDGIAMINWSGQGSRVLEDEAAHNTIAAWTPRAVATANDYNYVPDTSADSFLRNKLSILELSDNEVVGLDPGVSTPTEAGLAVENAPPVSGVVDLTAMTGADDAFIGGIIYNSTRNEWAWINDNETTTDTVTVADEYDTMVAAWTNGDVIDLYDATALGIGDVNTFDAYVESTGVMDLVGATSTATGTYADGRIVNLDTGEWAQVLTNTEGATDTVTIAKADRAKVAAWTLTTTDVALLTKDQHSGVRYCIPITGGSFTLENNFTYLVPEELATVNLPLSGFTGSRATSGSFTAYLNTGAEGSGGLLQDMLAKIQDSVSNNYHLKFLMGGNTGTYVEFDIPHANVSVPTTNVEDLITTEISFTAKGWNEITDEASFEATNELTVEYFT